MPLNSITQTLSQFPSMVNLVLATKAQPLATPDSIASRLEATTKRYGERTAVVFEGKTLTWTELNAMANRYVQAFKGLGLKKGDTASLLMENRIEFIAVFAALNKLGVIAALLNTNLSGKALAHCISITDCKMCIFGEERMTPMEGILNDGTLTAVESYIYVPDSGQTKCPTWARDLQDESQDEDDSNPSETGTISLGDTATYIFTSGTTGLPKAAVLSNRRFLLSTTIAAMGGLRCDVNDRIYLCLPVYHGTALIVGMGSSFTTGASMLLRRKFSASAFLDDVREHGVTCFIYIGEICRYLLSTPQKPDDYKNPLGTIMGNGLRPDIWMEFKQRFGIQRVAELYGSSEGNLGFLNILNKDCTVGMTSLPHALVEYDVDADEIVRNRQGYCKKVKNGQPGLMLGKITRDTAFEGYTNEDATQSKILRDVFQAGDAWFNTGDLMKTVPVGFAFGKPHYQFVDRVGDTFRWKGENVSTNEVGEVINAHPQIQFSNVYGVTVPATDGRAGMAALLLGEGEKTLKLKSFSQHICEQLPSYARPLFLRILPEMDTTGTFKMLKGELQKQAFDPTSVSDTLYVMKSGSEQYEPLEPAFAKTILAGKAGY